MPGQASRDAEEQALSPVPADLHPRHPVLGRPELPEWVKGFRPHQLAAIEEVVGHYDAGVKVVILDAPTGSGKTLLGEMTRRLLNPTRTLYCCTTLGLQDQVEHDFPYASVLKGRTNYPTLDHPELHRDPVRPLSAADCTRTKAHLPACSGCRHETTTAVPHCGWCHPTPLLCPYQVAKSAALDSPLAVTNTAYLLTEANGPGQFSGIDLVVADEADELEPALMRYVEVVVGRRRREQLGLGLPTHKTKEDDWAQWIEWSVPKIRDEVKRLGRLTDPPTPETLKEMTSLQRMVQKLRRLEKDLGDEEGTKWVYDPKEHDRGHAVFRPVRVDAMARGLLWDHGTRWLCMSATLIDPSEFAMSLGLEEAEWDVVRVQSTFPPERRPIHVIPGPPMNRDNREKADPVMVDLVGQILTKHPTARTLVHTVSYDLAEVLERGLGDTDHKPRVLRYGSAKEREEVLDRYRGMPGSVLIAPSLDRGVDLPQAMCRVQVIAKVPYANLGDPQVARRLYGTRGGELWYAVSTIRDLVQMTGRGMRSADDYVTCVAPGTRVLTGDLRWVPAEQLMVGDPIMGFTEAMATRQEPRRWEHGHVIATGIEELDRRRITLANGKVLVVTPEHRWLSKWGQARDNSWVFTDHLRPGHHLNRYVDVWETAEGRTAGWLAGFFDGEGHLSLRQGKRNPNVTGVCAAQKPGVVMDEAEQIAKSFGFTTVITPNASGVHHLYIRGGLAEHLRFLGEMRPLRLLEKFQREDVSAALRTTRYDEVVSVEDIGPGPMVTMATSTETYFAEGYGSHNTYILDRQFMKLYREWRRVFPKWWVEGLRWEGRVLEVRGWE